MKCEEVREQFVEMVPAGAVSGSREVASHLAGCEACTEALKSFKSTMSLLDEWRAPEPSPYFYTRFNAQLAAVKAEEASRPALLSWLRKPAFGMPVWRPVAVGVLALAMAVGVGVFQSDNRSSSGGPRVQAAQGTAVGDLQVLERDQDMFSDFDVLDDLPPAQLQNTGEEL
jgi:anti-sigma factor RsiW